MPPKKRTQKQKQSQKQSVVVNVKVERPARRKRSTKPRGRVSSAVAPEMKQLPAVSYIMQGGTNLPYWTQSTPFVVAPSKPISIPKTTGTMPVISETPITEVALESPVAISPKTVSREEMTMPVSRLSLEIPATPISFTEQIERPAKSISEMIAPEPEPISTEEMMPPTEKKITSNSSRGALEKVLMEKFGDRPEFLKTFKSKRELYQYYKQQVAVSAEEQNVLDVAEIYGKPKPQSMVSELTFPSMSVAKVSASSIATTKEMSSPSIIYDNPAKKPFWSRVIPDESEPELRI